jgi:hypothetical protein
MFAVTCRRPRLPIREQLVLPFRSSSSEVGERGAGFDYHEQPAPRPNERRRCGRYSNEETKGRCLT